MFYLILIGKEANKLKSQNIDFNIFSFFVFASRVVKFYMKDYQIET